MEQFDVFISQRVSIGGALIIAGALTVASYYLGKVTGFVRGYKAAEMAELERRYTQRPTASKPPLKRGDLIHNASGHVAIFTGSEVVENGR